MDPDHDEGTPRELKELLASLHGGALEYPDIERAVGNLAEGDWGDIERWARDELRRLPTPLRRSEGHETAARRRPLERILAVVDRLRGIPDALLRLQREEWLLEHQSAVPYLRTLVRVERLDEAAATARFCLAMQRCDNREAVEAVLAETGKPPDGWTEAVLAFARDPSVDAWDELMRFTPEEVLYDRTRNTLQMLIKLGADPNVLFRCATRHGTTSDAIELADRGLVDPDVIVERGNEGPPRARGLWFGLAAVAAWARGDRFNTVRFLRDGYEASEGGFGPEINAMQIRETADAELHALLDGAGIPKFEAPLDLP